jgi:23S rRNA (uracil1939-C5)-methyltransferase
MNRQQLSAIRFPLSDQKLSPMADLLLTIDTLTYGPSGLGRHQGRVILVPLTAPGDKAAVRIVQERRNHAIGELSRLHQASSLRQTPPCPYFGACGGCAWQHIQYETQLAAKERNVLDALRRIGRLDGFEFLPIVRSPQEYRYRRRIRLHANERKRLGFHRASSRETIEVESCLIADAQVDRHIADAQQWIGQLSTPIQTVEIVRGDEDGQTVLIGTALGRLVVEDDAICDRFLRDHDDLHGLILNGTGWRKAWGKETVVLLSEGGARLECEADAFSQVSREGNNRLVREVLEWGEFQDGDRLLELYSGAGNFTLTAARLVGEILAVEGDRPAVQSGMRNSQRNGLSNIRWLHSHVPAAIKQIRESREVFSKILLNPPRTGAKDLADDLASFRAEKILYVSCDPPTLARDLTALCKKGYKLKRVRPFDLFPQTFHVETLAELVR